MTGLRSAVGTDNNASKVVIMIGQSLRVALIACLASWAGFAAGAQISAAAVSDTIGVGESTTVEIYLELQGGEEASVFNNFKEPISQTTSAESPCPLLFLLFPRVF